MLTQTLLVVPGLDLSSPCSYQTIFGWQGRESTATPLSRTPPMISSHVPPRNESTPLDIQTALGIARDTQEGPLDLNVELFLEGQLGSVIQHLRSRSGYILSKDEFALFNYFRYRFEDEEFTQPAIARFWSNHYEITEPEPELEPFADRRGAQVTDDGDRPDIDPVLYANDISAKSFPNRAKYNYVETRDAKVSD